MHFIITVFVVQHIVNIVDWLFTGALTESINTEVYTLTKHLYKRVHNIVHSSCAPVGLARQESQSTQSLSSRSVDFDEQSQ